jgi:hypothetical protein
MRMMRLSPVLPLLFLLAGCTPVDSPSGTPAPSAATTASGPSPKPGLSASPAISPVAAPSVAASPRPVAAADTGQPAAVANIQLDSAGSWREFDRGGGRNVVSADNTSDGRFRARGNAELDRIHGDDVTPVNLAQAHARCTDCQTIAAAVQIVVYKRGASSVAPLNRAEAVNEDCTRCVTVARAIQYVIPVDSLNEIPPEVNELVRRVNREADYFERIKDLDKTDPHEAEARLNQLEADFTTLQQYLSDMVDEKEAATTPTPSPAASPGPTISSQASPGPTTTPQASPRPSITAQASVTPTATSSSTPGLSRAAATVLPAGSPTVP